MKPYGLGRSAGGLHWGAVDEELDARGDYFFSLLQTVLDGVVIADRVTQCDRPLLRHRAATDFRRDVNEGLASDANDRKHGNGGSGRGAPDHACLDQLLVAKTIERAVDRRFGQHSLNRVINLL